MSLTRLIRPVHTILTSTAVALVAVTALVSGTGTTPSASREGPHTSLSREATPFALSAVSAYPALTRGTYESRVQTWVNRARRNHGLRALTLQSCADHVANAWSDHLASTDSLYHQSMTALLDRCNAYYAGETLGQGAISPRTLVSMWMHSTVHRHILLSPSPRRIGIGATPNARGEWVVAAEFMRF